MNSDLQAVAANQKRKPDNAQLQVFCKVAEIRSPLPFRFLKHITFRVAGCWNWSGPTVFNPRYPDKKYGIFDFWENRGTPQRRHSSMSAHRYAYTHLIAPVEANLDLDHLCENKLCVNPAHLEPVTRSENMKRIFRRRMVTSL